MRRRCFAAAVDSEDAMRSYPRNLKLDEFARIFRRRYVVDDGDGLRTVTLSKDELLFLSQILYSGIIDWTEAPANGAGVLPDLGETLEQFTNERWMGGSINVTATEEDLIALGAFVVRGLVDVLMTADLVCAGLKSGESKYAGQ
jgi:hypothetical protein